MSIYLSNYLSNNLDSVLCFHLQKIPQLPDLKQIENIKYKKGSVINCLIKKRDRKGCRFRENFRQIKKGI